VQWALWTIGVCVSFFHCVCSNAVYCRSSLFSDRHLYEFSSVAAIPAAFVLKGAYRFNGDVPLL
jgi:hypothetical protein